MATFKKQIDIDEEDYKWFRKNYPDASISWLLGILLHHFKEASGNNHFDTIQKAVKLSKEEIDEMD